MRRFGLVVGIVSSIILGSCRKEYAYHSDDTNERYKGQYYGKRPKHMDHIPDAYARHPYVGGGYARDRR